MSYPNEMHYWVQSVLPLVYDGSLSYYEVVAKCVDYINNLVAHDKEIDDEIDRINRLIDTSDLEKLEELLEEMDVLEEKVSQFETELENVEQVLRAIDFSNPTVISTTGQDLDTYTTGGVWYFIRSSKPTHRPRGNGGGFLIVMKGRSMQRLFQVWVNMQFGNPGSGNTYDVLDVYVRNNSKDPVAWGNWQTLLNYGTTIKKNNPKLIEELIAVAKTYYDNNEYLQYHGGETFLDTDNPDEYMGTDATTGDPVGYIDCAAFVGLCMRGLKFEDTPISPTYTGEPQLPTFWGANPAYTWAWNPFDYFVSTGSTSYENRCRKASQFAKLMYENGMQVPIDTLYANIEPGDMLFYAKRDNGAYTGTFYGNITHVALCYSKSNTPITVGDITYPYTHEVMDSPGNGGPAIRLMTLEGANNTVDLVMVCRPDLGSIEENYPVETSVPITIHDGQDGRPQMPSTISTINGVIVSRSGKVVTVYIRLKTATSSYPTAFGSSTIASNLPPALSAPLIPSGGVFMPHGNIWPRVMRISNTDTPPENYTAMNAKVTTDGKLQVSCPIGIGNNNWEYLGSFVYICK